MDRPTEVQNLEHEIATLREQMIAMNRLFSVGQLAAGVIHEINTPIASIFSNIEVLQKSLDVLERQMQDTATPKARQIVETMRSLLAVDRVACERISAIVRSLKTHARAGDEEFRDTAIEQLLDDSLRLIQADVKNRVTIQTEYEALPPVQSIPHLLGQAFLNILVNAAQAIPGEGSIIVRVKKQGDFAVIEIEDTGVGITIDCKNRLLAGGFTTKPLGEGTGLGLAISRQIVVDRHGGSLDFESEPGKGTTFFVRIPLRHQPAGEA